MDVWIGSILLGIGMGFLMLECYGMGCAAFVLSLCFFVFAHYSRVPLKR